MRFSPAPSPQRGYALITAIIFVVLLTLIALTALKSSGLEAKMGANNVLHTQAFEASESVRSQIETLVDANLFVGGWPVSAANGTYADSEFDAAALALFTSPLSACSSGTPTRYGFCLSPIGGAPVDWYSLNSECTNTFPCAKFPSALDVDGIYSIPLVSTDTTRTINGTVAVYRLNTAPGPGNNLSTGCGYLGQGKCVSKGGSFIFYYINGHGRDLASSPQAGVDTSTIFREVVR